MPKRGSHASAKLPVDCHSTSPVYRGSRIVPPVMNRSGSENGCIGIVNDSLTGWLFMTPTVASRPPWSTASKIRLHRGTAYQREHVCWDGLFLRRALYSSCASSGNSRRFQAQLSGCSLVAVLLSRPACIALFNSAAVTPKATGSARIDKRHYSPRPVFTAETSSPFYTPGDHQLLKNLQVPTTARIV